MNFKELFVRLLPYWTLVNLGLAAVSVVSAGILFLTREMYPVTESLLQFTLVSLMNVLFLFYWSLWFVVAVPPIIGGLYLSRENPDYYRFAFQNTVAVVVLYLIKILFGFDVMAIAG